MASTEAPKDQDDKHKASSEPIVVQEPKKSKGVVGEKLWGPYKVHEGADITSKYSGGPWGLGDPDDTTLRKVEKEILIPNIIKKKAKTDYCKEANDFFFKCAEEQGVWRMTYKCRDPAARLRECVSSALKDPAVVEKSTQDYLAMRAEYRRTGKRLLLKRV